MNMVQKYYKLRNCNEDALTAVVSPNAKAVYKFKDNRVHGAVKGYGRSHVYDYQMNANGTVTRHAVAEAKARAFGNDLYRHDLRKDTSRVAKRTYAMYPSPDQLAASGTWPPLAAGTVRRPAVIGRLRQPRRRFGALWLANLLSSALLRLAKAAAAAGLALRPAAPPLLLR